MFSKTPELAFEHFRESVNQKVAHVVQRVNLNFNQMQRKHSQKTTAAEGEDLYLEDEETTHEDRLERVYKKQKELISDLQKSMDEEGLE